MSKRDYRIRVMIKERLGIPKNRIGVTLFYGKLYVVEIRDNIASKKTNKVLDVLGYIRDLIPNLYDVTVVSNDNIFHSVKS